MEASSSSASTAAAVPEEKKAGDKEMTTTMYKTKVIQFLGRTTPIILQNDNGPCPLLAICNVLLLKNNLSLSPDIPEVSQEKLLSLVAERLIDSNSNVNDKDAGYVENQQQNIGDAIDLLPRLATGIDVNIKFRRIDDFEFTRECAIFDLLDIPLYHGWIVDPQDFDTASAIGTKSYNTLMGELVALETQNMQIDHHKARKGDMEEEAELSRILKLSKSEVPTPSANDPFPGRQDSSIATEGSSGIENSERNGFDESQNPCPGERPMSTSCDASSNHNFESKDSEPVLQAAVCLSPRAEQENPRIESISGESENNATFKIVKDSGDNTCVNTGSVPNQSSLRDPFSTAETDAYTSAKDEDNQALSSSTSGMDEVENKGNGYETFEQFSLLSQSPHTDSLNGRMHNPGEPQTFISNIDAIEPIYEGEESILESRDTTHQNREPMYEGEVALVEQGDRKSNESHDTKKDEITVREGELMRNFLKNSASQLTIYGLFCLQEGLKERELCVFFRNNHFNTMFKFEGQLYILATDQGYINQPDLVWEKLNEVNGNTVFMTGNFKEFKVENHGNNSWDEQNAVASTADYIASIDNSAQADSSFNSDLQLAIALQQQEFEQQTTQRHSNSQQPSVDGSRLVTGTQVPRNSGKYTSQSSKQESKSAKDKCVVM